VDDIIRKRCGWINATLDILAEEDDFTNVYSVRVITGYMLKNGKK
jgi:hypothetical protein